MACSGRFPTIRTRHASTCSIQEQGQFRLLLFQQFDSSRPFPHQWGRDEMGVTDSFHPYCPHQYPFFVGLLKSLLAARFT